jgi:hypothetical protein
MRSLHWLASCVLILASIAAAQSASYNGQCAKGGQTLPSGTKVIASYPNCTVTVFQTGTQNTVTIFQDPALAIPLSNPFTANSDGSFLFFTTSGSIVDISMSGGGLPSVVTLTGIVIGSGGGVVISGAGVPTGVVAGSVLVSAGVGNPPIYQTKPIIDVRDVLGIDCTGASDSSAALNTLLTNVSRKHVIWPVSCPIRADNQIVISGQSSVWIDGGASEPQHPSNGPLLFGCNGATGPLLYINRSGYVRISGLNIEAKGQSCTSNFTGSVGIDNSGGTGVTTTHIFLDHNGFATNWAGAAITNYIGVNVGISGQNMEDIRLHDNSIACQNSSNSYGVRWAGLNADTGEIYHNSINGCYQGARIETGQVSLLFNKFGGNGDKTAFPTGGASIYLGGSVGPLLIEENNSAEGSGQFINSGNDASGVGAANTVTLIGNFWQTDRMYTNLYGVNLGTTGQTFILEGNKFSSVGTSTKPCVGSDSQGNDGQGYPNGPLGRLIDLGGNTCDQTMLQSQLSGNSYGYFQSGESHPYGTVGTNWTLQAKGANVVGGGISPFLTLRSQFLSAGTRTNDDYAFFNVPNSTTASTIVLDHPAGVSSPAGLSLALPIVGGLQITSATSPASTPTGVNPVGGTGNTTWGYKIVGVTASGTTAASAEKTTAIGVATLTTSSYNQVQFTPDAGIAYWQIYRTTAGGSPNTTGLIGTVHIPTATLSNGYTASIMFNDTGLSGDSSSPPTANTTGELILATVGATGKAACIRSDKSIGYCSTQPDGTGSCTCN